VTPEPGASAFDRLRALEEDAAFLRRAFDTLADEDARRAHLSKVAAARFGKLEEDLREAVALLPRKPGRPRLEKTPPSFLQEIRRLHEELGWGRPRIVAAMRDRGLTEWEVRLALAEAAGEKAGSSTAPGSRHGGTGREEGR
jgi:hypothetical protein